MDYLFYGRYRFDQNTLTVTFAELEPDDEIEAVYIEADSMTPAGDRLFLERVDAVIERHESTLTATLEVPNYDRMKLFIVAQSCETIFPMLSAFAISGDRLTPRPDGVIDLEQTETA